MSALAKAVPPAGLFVAVVGPSGAGKDALIRGLAGRLGEADGVFTARRVVTRRADAFEDHDTLAEDAFAAALAQGRFALAWSAHGLHYGVPREIEARLAAGQAVVCNVSRAMVAEVRRLYRPSLVVLVTARPQTLAARLAARGRDDGASRRQRLARSAVAEVAFEPDATIDNDGALDEAVARLCDLVIARRRSAAP
jgi:ribose 1,5-bisphosphokinase